MFTFYPFYFNLRYRLLVNCVVYIRSFKTITIYNLILQFYIYNLIFYNYILQFNIDSKIKLYYLQ